MSRSRLIRILAFDPADGHCFHAKLPDTILEGDTSENPFASEIVLLENGLGLGPPHAPHATIARSGGGAYSHWHNLLYFSTSDNSDPRINGREYQLYLPAHDEVPSKAQTAARVLQALSKNFVPAEAYTAIERCLSILYPQAKIGEDEKVFWRDEQFLSAYQRLCGDNYRSLERKYAAYNLAKSVLSIGGDIAECGAYKGGTAYFLALAIQQSGQAGGVFLFDSFEGLSAPGPQDGLFWHAGSLSAAEEACRENLRAFDNVTVLRGWIPERFGEVASRSFCFLHVDVGLYQPTKDSIAFFYPRMLPGGMIVCDDYGFATCPGAKLAFDEFLADKPEKIIHLPTGQGLVIKR